MIAYGDSVNKQKLLIRILVISAPILLFVSCLAFKQSIIELTTHFPKCFFYAATNHYCPACGNTRSVISLLNFDIPAAIKYNITPIVLGVIVLAFYCELAAYTFGKRVRIVPRSNVFLFTVLISMLVYYFVRNFFI